MDLFVSLEWYHDIFRPDDRISLKKTSFLKQWGDAHTHFVPISFDFNHFGWRNNKNEFEFILGLNNLLTEPSFSVSDYQPKKNFKNNKIQIFSNSQKLFLFKLRITVVQPIFKIGNLPLYLRQLQFFKKNY